MKPYETGEEVQIAYTGYHTIATILEPEDRWGWVKVREIRSVRDNGTIDRDWSTEKIAPEYQAHADYISRPDEPIKPGPFETWPYG